mmetsp:Transcript_4064/g.8813  ORF Transcript_4064/g.8813 Transcript_4064/m.8813 type:complete len:286 (-) Transcript_4064:1234-2091(-)
MVAAAVQGLLCLILAVACVIIVLFHSSITSLHSCKQQMVDRQALVQDLGIIRAEVGHVTVLHHRDVVAGGQQLQLMCDPDDSLVLEHALDAVVEDVQRSMLVHSTERVVQQHDVSGVVGGPRQANTLPLTTRQVDATQPTLALVTQGQDLQVKLKGAVVDDAVVVLLVPGLTKHDAVAHRQVLAPGVLGHIGDAAASRGLAAELLHVAQHCVDEGGLAGTHTAHHSHQLTGPAAELLDLEAEVVGTRVAELAVVHMDSRLAGDALTLRDVHKQEVLNAVQGSKHV